MQGTDLITTAQVAAAKGVNPRTVARWVQSGRLPYATKLPGETGAYLFDPAVVDAFDTEAAEAAAS